MPSARATRTTPRSARRRAPWRDRPGRGRRLARADRLPRERRVRRRRACGGSAATPTSSWSASSRRRHARPAASQRSTPTPIDGRRATLGVATILRTRAPARARGDRRGPRARAGAPGPRRLRADRAGRRCSTLAHGALNLHPSLLPRHRGATPIPATILAGDTETGVTLMRMDAGLDTGPIVAQAARGRSTATETAPALEARARGRAADLLDASLGPWLRGELDRRRRSPRPARR